MFTRLRWSAFGLRGRIIGAVLATAAVTLLVAGLVLLPQLEHALRTASTRTLTKEVQYAENHHELQQLADIQYTWIVPALLRSKDPRIRREAERQCMKLASSIDQLKGRFGAEEVTLIGWIDAQGVGVPIIPEVSSQGCAPTPPKPDEFMAVQGNIASTFMSGTDSYQFGRSSPILDAVIWVKPDAVLDVRKSIDEIPAAETDVRDAFEIAALAAIGMTLLIAIPLARRLVGRLRRLREAALRIAIDGTGHAHFPVDRAHDEVGDLARSFSIMQRRLRQQEEARRAFVATASHELRTPLASLDGMLELLADDIQSGRLDIREAAALLDRARAQSRRLGRLAADLLDLSRIDAEVALRSEPVELSELGRAVLAEFDLSSRDRDVSTVLDDQPAPVWALADPGSVARILRILLDNALRVAPSGSEVRVTVTGQPAPSLSVSDSGPGVAPEERALIFDRFKRGRETGGEAGFGLGLAIGRELAQRMGGSLVLADSAGPGATFTLNLMPTQAPTPSQLTSTSV